MLESYPQLEAFLKQFGGDQRISDEQIARDYARLPAEHVAELYAETAQFLVIDPFPADDVSDATRRIFRCEEDARGWLDGVVGLVRTAAADR